MRGKLIFLLIFMSQCHWTSFTDDKQTITALAGDTATLPCQAYSSVNITTVKWTTPKLEESSKEEYVWLLRDGHINAQNQHPDFTDRVEAAGIQLNNGNLSISLKNVTRNDTETFICQYIDSDAKKGNCTVLLNVTESGDVWQVFVIFVVVAVPSVGVTIFALYWLHRKSTKQVNSVPERCRALWTAIVKCAELEPSLASTNQLDQSKSDMLLNVSCEADS